MNRDDIMRMAWEASKGMLSYDAEGEWRLNQREVEVVVALAYEAGRKDENEACAVLCESDDWRVAAALIRAGR